MFDNDVEAAKAFVKKFSVLKSEISKKIVGQNQVIDQILTSIFTNGHVLLVGVPGLAKTLIINTIADCMGLSFNRIQFTPDLMPSDIIGSEILDSSRNFNFINGPIFANVILADEINRTPPKTQAALLEAMQEKSVTVAGKKYDIDKPFFVLATQNPIEQEGTYPLPEAQLDRFMFNVLVEYPSFEDELAIVEGTTSNKNVTINKVVTSKEILYFQDLVRRTPIAENVIDYAVKLSVKTRPNEKLATSYIKKYVSWGAGPRASQFLVLAAKCNALLSGKFSPDIEDVKKVAKPILRHRIVRNYIAEADGLSVENIIENIL